MTATCDSSGLLDVGAALEAVCAAVTSLSDMQSVSISQALDRIIFEDVLSPIAVPTYDNSAMDGYALVSHDVKPNSVLKVVGESFAGAPFVGEIKHGQCVRVMTGAKIPSGADTVVMQENVSLSNDEITIFEKVWTGANIRLAGSDIKKNQKVLSKGRRVTAIDIGLLNSIGLESTPVFRRLRVALFSTGDELTPPGEPLIEGAIYDSNRPMLCAMLQKLGAEVVDLGVIRDEPTSIKSAFKRACNEADCVITSGGVSVGEADYTREILEKIGSVNFWKVAMKPGKPLAFGVIFNKPFFGLPGNPVSAAVTFEKIAAVGIRKMMGENALQPMSCRAKAAFEFRKKPGRVDFQRAYLWRENDELWVRPSGVQSSGVLSGYVDSNCYAVLEKNRGTIAAGEMLNVEMF